MESPAPAKLEVRNLRFATDRDEVPRHWHGGRKAVTAFFDNLSVFFPKGEAFFIESVKAHKHLVADEQLLQDIARFCAQEGIHAREHDRYNAMLRRQGYPVEALEARVERVLARARRVLPRRAWLSATAALEHFTATMANELLDDPRMLEGAHPVMRALWRWHAAEEVEHRAVAFDVYRAANGPYVERCATMLIATAIFWPLVLDQQIRMMRADGVAGSFEEWRDLLGFLFVEPGGLRRMWIQWLDYFRPDFHPLDGDTGALAGWKAEHAAEKARSAAT